MAVDFSKKISLNSDSQSKPYRNALVEVTLLVVICGLFYWFVILPKQNEIGIKNSQLTQVQAEETQVSGNLATLQNLVKNLKSDSQNISQLDQTIPLDGNVVRLQLLIQSLAGSAGVTVGNISISGQPNTAVAGDTALLANPYGVSRTLRTLSGTVFVVGSFSQLQNFLQQIEASGRLMDVTNLTISQDSQGQLNMQVTLNAYYLAP
jgi:Tfp pilus assembly protein PilO